MLAELIPSRIQPQEVSTASILWDLMEELKPTPSTIINPYEDNDNRFMVIRYIDSLVYTIEHNNRWRLNEVNAKDATNELKKCVNSKLDPLMVFGLVNLSRYLPSRDPINKKSIDFRSKFRRFINDWEDHTGIGVNNLCDYDSGLLTTQ